eukprot:scaffold48880_cov22-Tisochrysis_lutea.AAC.1
MACTIILCDTRANKNLFFSDDLCIHEARSGERLCNAKTLYVCSVAHTAHEGQCGASISGNNGFNLRPSVLSDHPMPQTPPPKSIEATIPAFLMTSWCAIRYCIMHSNPLDFKLATSSNMRRSHLPVKGVPCTQLARAAVSQPTHHHFSCVQ